MYQSVKEAQEEQETTETFSSIMRELNKNFPDKVRDFMISFKNAFDESLISEVDDPDSVALMQAMNDIDYTSLRIETNKEYRLQKMAETMLGI